MIKYEDDCVGCPPEMSCIGDSCPNRRSVQHFYCDRCGDDVEELYFLDGQELCENCLKDNFEKITL